ncbi:family 16 glycosylhydrolase [Thalassotalea agariperforans]
MRALKLITLFPLILSTYSIAEVVRPTGFEAGNERWQLKGNRSDDFSGDKLNTAIWQNAPKSLIVGAWTFEQDNSFVKDGKLNIQVTQETHTRKFPDVCQGGKRVDRELFYKSGAVRTHAESVYGFYEARIKGVKVFPGLSPAFWLYSDGHPYSDSKVEGSVDYSEIDIVELQQADWHGPKADDADPINVMDHNLHARLIGKNGKKIWRRPKPFPAEQLLRYEAPFDPSEDFHTYAVENRKDKISWYVDGKLVGEKANLFWHRPMHLILSMGLRRQFIKYNAKCQRADPNPDNVTKVGFPEDATMQIDYVKTWQALPAIWLDNADKLLSTAHHNQQSLMVNIKYHAGSDYHLVEGKSQGITIALVEKNADGFVRLVTKTNDAAVLAENKRYGGELAVALELDNIKPSDELAKGHYYALSASFNSSNGKEIYLTKDISPIIIKD